MPGLISALCLSLERAFASGVQKVQSRGKVARQKPAFQPPKGLEATERSDGAAVAQRCGHNPRCRRDTLRRPKPAVRMTEEEKRSKRKRFASLEIRRQRECSFIKAPREAMVHAAPARAPAASVPVTHVAKVQRNEPRIGRQHEWDASQIQISRAPNEVRGHFWSRRRGLAAARSPTSRVCLRARSAERASVFKNTTV
ncbi:hypothetical protein M885DRAFT_32811 [Pelagophyceae sp. CCMP2097]|nr:hypothetical protein M885DRAFT_32811 [Pelagophyceae sp. CCMP2097]